MTEIPSRLKIDYRNTTLLKFFINKYGKIRPRRVTKLAVKQQRQVAKAIRKSRALGLIPCSVCYIGQPKTTKKN